MKSSNILDHSEESIRLFLQQTGKTRVQLEREMARNKEEHRELFKLMDTLPRLDPNDPNQGAQAGLIGYQIVGEDGDEGIPE